MKAIWDISEYKPNEIVTNNNIEDLLGLQKVIWDNDVYYFDVAEAKRFYKFTRKLTPDKGKRGIKLNIAIFQLQVCTDILCVKRRKNKKRRFREALIDLPRKNGKSFLVGLITTYLYFFRSEYGGEFIVASVSRQLATLLFNQILHFVRNTPLEQFCKIRYSYRELYRKEDNSYMRVISSDAANANSYADFVFCLDEVHEFKDQELYSRLTTGQGIFDEPLGLLITTAGNGEDELNLELEKYNYAKAVASGSIDDDTYYYAIFEADEDCNVLDETQWYKANPGLGLFRKTEDFEILSKRATLSKLAERSFRRFLLNQHVSSEIKNAIDMGLWDDCTEIIDYDDIKHMPNTAGLDLSSNCDITAFVQCFNDEANDRYILYPHLFIPAPRVDEKEKEDRVPYSLWAKQGYVNLCDNGYISYKHMKEYIRNNCVNNEILAFDRWGSAEIVEDLEENFNVLDFGQGFKTMSPAINTFEQLLIDKKIVIAKNPCLRWMAKNTVAVVDDAGNIKYSKRKSRKKIDGIIALVMALSVMYKEKGYDVTAGVNRWLDMMEEY